MKHHDVLTLNRSFAPVHIITWQTCMNLLIKEHAHALDRDFIAFNFEDWMKFSNTPTADDYNKIRTVSKSIAIPEIITLKFYNHLPQKVVKFSRQSVFARDKFICQYCKEMFQRDDLTIDHVIPRSRGGATTWDNIVTCCIPCNSKKADKTLAEVQERYPQDGNRWHLKMKPFKPKWISPIANLKNKAYICRSWAHFMKKVDTTFADEPGMDS